MVMKTAVSLPDSLFEAAERTATYLGIPRSQLFARALEEFIGNHEGFEVTERLDRVYTAVEPAEPPADLASVEALRNLTKHDTW